MRKIDTVLGRLDKEYPDADIALLFDGVFQLLVAVMLSAQCTDVVVNKVTPRLFAKFGDAVAMAKADVREVEKLIYSTGFYRNKARNVVGAARMIVADFGAEVPCEMEDLLKLPGVARKTANVVMNAGFGKAVGIVVDTHVGRISRLLGLTEQKDAVKVEKELMKIVPKKKWGRLPYLFIEHGRKVCIARRPQCRDCVLSDICPSSQV
ncbi:endonuclease III [Patescibacteria group bacterium]|nr:endonuclease III [Patescibacteria group bacterium]